MAEVAYSRSAEADLRGIAGYTLQAWGAKQAARYLNDLEQCCHLLAENPLLGRSCEEIRPGLRRMEHGEHIVFYRRQAKGILVSRILHRNMLPERHSIEEED